MKNVKPILLLLLVLVALTTACGADEIVTDKQATATALVSSIIGTATADARDEVSPQDALATAEAAATEAAQQQEDSGLLADQATEQAATEAAPSPTSPATATAQVTPTPAATPATAPSPEELAVHQELASLGLDSSSGALAWLHPPARLEVAGFQQFSTANEFPDTVAQDFVLAADITWNTEFGDAGCGFAFRATGLDADASLYVAILVRRDNGHAILQSRQDGIFLDDDLFDIRVTDLDPEFASLNDTTNRFVVVAQGNAFSLFSNGTPLGQVTPANEFAQGGVAFVTLSDSGTTSCQFDNGWLWNLN